MSYNALFAIAAARDYEVEQMDVKTAFLYGTIDEDIYMEQPTGMADRSSRVCQLQKALDWDFNHYMQMRVSLRGVISLLLSIWMIYLLLVHLWLRYRGSKPNSVSALV